MDIVSLIISVVSGAVGGNVAGSLMKDYSLGPVGNSIAGIFGGGIGAWLLQAVGLLASGGGGLTLGSIIGNIASGGVGGAILMLVIGLIKGMSAQR